MQLDDIAVRTLRGQDTTFGEIVDGRLALVVNVASRCGLAPQYEQLEALHREYGPRGFTVVGVPSNQFLQELGSSDAGRRGQGRADHLELREVPRRAGRSGPPVPPADDAGRPRGRGRTGGPAPRADDRRLIRPGRR
jgi:hypothetical protein